MDSHSPEIDRDIRFLTLCYQILAAVLILADISIIASFFPIIPSLIPPGVGFFLSQISEMTPAVLKPWSLLVVGFLEALLLFEVGSSLRQGESRTFVLIMAWIITAFFPLGTVLGAFTIWKLFRDGEQQRHQSED